MSIPDTHNRILPLCKPVLIKKNHLRNVSYLSLVKNELMANDSCHIQSEDTFYCQGLNQNQLCH